VKGRGNVSLNRLRIIVLGYIVRGPIGGMTWHHLQYVLGLSRLGHDVYFMEDSDDYPSCYDPSTNGVDVDPSYGLSFTARVFDRIGLVDRWAYHDAHIGRWCGPAAARALDICASADVLLNVSAVNPLRDWFARVPVRVLIDTDPAFLQIRHLQKESARQLALGHTAFLSFGENIGGMSALPHDGLPWFPTRQPVVLDCWPVTAGPKDGKFTTVMQWDSYAPAQHEGRTFGMKSMSFGPYRDLPQKAPARFELAIGNPPKELPALGWTVTNPLEVTKDPWTYQAFIMQSKAEFTVAKHGYVVSRSGWFSERSACYLSCGRPVLVQDTGFTAWLPAGEGVIPFTDPSEALAGVEEINARYDFHCARSRELAAAYFGSDEVLTRLLVLAHDAPPAKVA
jgi:hypothetical protein